MVECLNASPFSVYKRMNLTCRVERMAESFSYIYPVFLISDVKAKSASYGRDVQASSRA